MPTKLGPPSNAVQRPYIRSGCSVSEPSQNTANIYACVYTVYVYMCIYTYTRMYVWSNFQNLKVTCAHVGGFAVSITQLCPFLISGLCSNLSSLLCIMKLSADATSCLTGRKLFFSVGLTVYWSTFVVLTLQMRNFHHWTPVIHTWTKKGNLETELEAKLNRQMFILTIKSMCFAPVAFLPLGSTGNNGRCVIIKKKKMSGVFTCRGQRHFTVTEKMHIVGLHGVTRSPVWCLLWS